MDSSASDFVLYPDGSCNFCRSYKSREPTKPSKESLDLFLKSIVSKNGYHGLLGVSGGLDSSYLAFLLKKWGLNPMLVHLDNSFNSEDAKHNISCLVDNTGFDIEYLSVDLDEYRMLQRSFIEAGVVDIELITDHALLATVYDSANRYGLKTIFSGSNFVTESIMPKSWSHTKADWTNIKSIYGAYYSKPLRKYPHLGFLKYLFYRGRGFHQVFPLNEVEYNLEVAAKTLSEEWGWKPYGLKHHESVFTRFYQNYILPVKFGVDKRKPHFSTLVCSGQISREDALERLKEPLYDEELLVSDKKQVLQHLGYTESAFDELMARPPVSHKAFKTADYYNFLRKIRDFKNKILNA